jgi:hypothetical protein
LEFFPVATVTVALLSVSPLVSACAEKKTQSKDMHEGQKKKRENSRIPEPHAIQHIPVGTFNAGSWPGESGRQPSLESTPVERELGPFRIDAYPYPGDPGQAPRLGVTATEAAVLCAGQKGRLCTELEWERACRGPDSAVYPSGTATCENASAQECLSGFDVSMMGSIPEWTKSTFGRESELSGGPVVRGAGKLPAGQRRCARRRGEEENEPVGFRCCYGAPNAASLKEPVLGKAYQEVELTLAELKVLLSSDEKTKALQHEVRMFKPEAAGTVLSRGQGQANGFTLTTRAVEWQPTRGSRILVVAGRSGKKTSFVLAYFMSEEKKTLAGSFIMNNEPGPIALAYAESIRPRIHFSSCWGCPGETGKVLFREPEELVLLQP